MTWIAVRQELPPEGVNVLAELALEHVIGKRDRGEFVTEKWTVKMSDVGYWMPLPEFPEPYDA